MKIKMNKLDKVSKISKDIVTPKNLNSSNFTVGKIQALIFRFYSARGKFNN